MAETWLARDRPILHAIVDLREREPLRPGPTYLQVAEESGFDLETVARSIDSLEGRFVEVQKLPSDESTASWRITELLPNASFASGASRKSVARSERISNAKAVLFLAALLLVAVWLVGAGVQAWQGHPWTAKDKFLSDLRQGLVPSHGEEPGDVGTFPAVPTTVISDDKLFEQGLDVCARFRLNGSTGVFGPIQADVTSPTYELRLSIAVAATEDLCPNPF